MMEHKSNSNILIFFVLILLCSTLVSITLHAEDNVADEDLFKLDEEIKVEELSSAKIDSQIAEIDKELEIAYKKKNQKEREIYNYFYSFVEEHPKSVFLPQLYFQLANLAYKIFPHDQYETYEKIVSFYHKVLENKENFADLSRVYFNLAYFEYLKEKIKLSDKRIAYRGKVEDLPDSLRLTKDKILNSINYYQTVLQQYPQSGLVDNSIYRLGDIYFDLANNIDNKNERKKYLNKAEQYYKKLASKKCSLQSKAMYKLGWVYFSKNDYSSTIVRFVYLLNKIYQYETQLDKTSNQSELEIARRFVNDGKIFKDEVVDYVALSFAGFDSTNFSGKSIGLRKFGKIYPEIKSRQDAQKVLQQLCSAYEKIDYPNFAIKGYEFFLELFPMHDNNPIYEQRISQIYALQDSFALVQKTNKQITEKYNSETDWFAHYQDSTKVMDKNLPVIKQAFEYSIGKAVNATIESGEEKKYITAINLSEEYLKLFPNSENAKSTENNLAQLYFDLAEKNQDIQIFINSINNYKNLNTKTTEVKAKIDNTYNIIVAYQSIHDILSSISQEKLQKVRKGIGLLIDEVNKNIIDYCIKYRNLVESADFETESIKGDLRKVYLLQSNVAFEMDNFKLTIEILKKLLQDYPKDPKLSEYSYKIAVCYHKLQQFAAAEKWFTIASDRASRSGEEDIKNSANSLTMEMVLKQAEKAVTSQNFSKAAENYEKLANMDLSGPGSFNYMLQAAQYYEKASFWNRAVNSYLFLAENYPNKDVTSQIIPAYYKAATITDSLLKDYDRAVDILETVPKRFPNNSEAKLAKQKVISIYENKLGNSTAATQEYLNYSEQYRDADMLDNAISIQKDNGNTKSMVNLCIKYIELFPDNPNVMDKYRTVLNYYLEEENWDKVEEFAFEINNRFPDNEQLVKGVLKMYLDTIEDKIDYFKSVNVNSTLSKMINKYRDKLNFYHSQEIDIEDPQTLAKITFYEGEILFEEFKQRKVRRTNNFDNFLADVKELIRQRKKITKIFLGVKQYGEIKWWTASLYRLGELNEYLHSELQNASDKLAQNFDEVQRKAFETAIQKNYISPIYEEMIRYFDANNEIGVKHDLKNVWIEKSRNKLEKLDYLKQEASEVKIDTFFYSGKDWKVTEDAKSDWYIVNFNDLLWDKAEVIEDPAILENFSSNQNPRAKVIWKTLAEAGTAYFRAEFVCPEIIENGVLKLIADNVDETYINGEQIQAAEIKEVEFGKIYEYYLTKNLTNQKNVLAVKISASEKNIGLLAEIHVFGIRKE